MKDSRQDDMDRRFIEDPQGLYRNFDTLDRKEREQLLQMEEALSGIFLKTSFPPGESSHSLQDREQDIAACADDPVRYADILKEHNAEVLSLQMSRRIMENAKIASRSLPEALAALVHRNSTAAEKRAEREAESGLMQSSLAAALPAFIIKIGSEGLAAVKNVVQGLEEIPLAFDGVRSSQESTAAPRVDLRQTSGTHLSMEYQIVKESANAIFMSIRFLKRPQGDCRIRLHRDGRIMDSRNLGSEEMGIVFNELKPGDYDLKIDGVADHSLKFVVDLG